MKFMENDLTVDRDMYISELQNYLRTIAAYRDNIPVIGVDGIYGQHTALAVSAFQHGANLPVTGITDLDTWNAIFAAYSEIRQRLAEAETLRLFPRSGILQIGDSSDAVHMLQLMLNRVAGRYINLLPVAVTGIYDEGTAQAIEVFQTCCLLEADRGKTDKRTWNHLVRLYHLV
ncbi:MAG: peptidoglycan-binding domain-containing protein [Acutalibacteraceae bacterium]|nr:peptidoglycan-binding protein [Clostridiales bacterium]